MCVCVCVCVFPIRWLQKHLVVFNSIWHDFVRLYYDSSHINMHLKKTSKLVNFCVAILILKMEVKNNVFGIVHFFQEKYKFNWNSNAPLPLHLTDLCRRVEKVLWLIEHVKSSLWCFMLEISLDDAPWWGGPFGVDSNQMKTLTKNSQRSAMWIYSKYPNQALKIICTSLIMLITLMFGSI